MTILYHVHSYKIFILYNPDVLFERRIGLQKRGDCEERYVARAG